MDKYINQAAAIEYLMTNMGWKDEDGYPIDDADEKRNIITDLISGIPASDVKPVVRGKWIFEEYEFASWCTKAICSSCKKTVANNSDLAHDWGQKLFLHDYKFCPKCGADMREVDDERE